jgi:hypothetical protein
LDRRLGGHQSRYGYGVEERISQPPPEIELSIVRPSSEFEFSGSGLETSKSVSWEILQKWETCFDISHEKEVKFQIILRQFR